MDIKKVEVQFDQYGQWSHPAIYALGEEFDEVPFKDIPQFSGIEILPIRVDDDETEILHGPDGDQPADFRKWQPDPPEGDEWFPFLYSEDEDGPYVLYARPKQVAQTSTAPAE